MIKASKPHWFSIEAITRLAPGQFWMIALVCLALAGFSAYRYWTFPRERARDSEAFSSALAGIDSLNARLRIENIVGGMPVHDADSIYAASTTRALGLTLQHVNSQEHDDRFRPVYLVVSFLLAAVLALIAWTWFGRPAATRIEG